MNAKRRHVLSGPVAMAIAVAATATAVTAAEAQARTALFSLTIGYNEAPAGETGLAGLRFADDDAASFHQLAGTMSDRSLLLTILDPQSQARFPDLGTVARPPSLVELRRAVAELQTALTAAATAGDEAVVLIFYSGHGWRRPDGHGSLALLDGELTQEALYDEVLGPLATAFVHLFVDACHAESVVRPRDLQAQVVSPTPDEVAGHLQTATLARFPRVGAIIASTAGAESHEWDGYGSGVFTHEILSALRGAADVDGDHRIEYSELAAFVAAANRNVKDVRARPRTLIKPPSLNPRAAIVDLRGMRGAAFLEGRPGTWGAFFVEDERGNRLLDLRADHSANVRLALPTGSTLYLRNARSEATLRPQPNQRLRFEELRPTAISLRSRGSLDSALRRGLFAAQFGPEYYRGFVDQSADLVSVEPPEVDLSIPAPTPGPSRRLRAGRYAIGASVALGVAAGALGAVAWKYHNDFEATDLEAPALEAKDRYQLMLGLSLGALVAAALCGSLGAYLIASDRPAPP
jgi:hypothetical protein